MRLLLGLALIGVLIATGALDFAAFAAVLRHPLPCIAAVAALFLTLPLAALRWRLLLGAQHIAIPGARVLRLVLGSSFYGTLLPGVIGGDVLRTALVVQAADRQRAAALLSILLDRALGLAGLLLVAIGLALVHPSALSRLVGTLALATFAAALVLLALAPRLAPLARRRGRLAALIAETALALRLWRAAPVALGAGLLLSLAIAGLDIAGLLLIVSAADPVRLSGVEQALAGTLALLANSLPLTPGGLGIGEAAYAQAATLLDGAAHRSPQAITSSAAPPAAYASVFLAYRCATALATVPGAFVRLRT